MKRILVGTDGSPGSQHAVRWAADLAAQCHAELVLAHVVLIPAEIPAAMSSQVSALREEMLKRGRAHLEEASRGLEGAGLQLLEGDDEAEALSRLATHADLLVVGHRGANALSRLLVGSVADRLVQICPKPVVVVR